MYSLVLSQNGEILLVAIAEIHPNLNFMDHQHQQRKQFSQGNIPLGMNRRVIYDTIPIYG